MLNNVCCDYLAFINNGADISSRQGLGDIAFTADIKDNDWNVVVHAEGERGRIHHLQVFAGAVLKGDGLVTHGIRIFLGVGTIDAIDHGSLHDSICSGLAGAQG